MRIDKYLFEKQYAKSRSYAATMIADGLVFCNGSQVLKASLEVCESDHIEIRGEILRYVSRGGLKLEGALMTFGIDVEDYVCIDVGSSTGGFTDCLLQRGAKRVYAVDSGSCQLHEKLSHDPRVIVMENTNVRYMTEDALPELCDIAVCDVSFISQTLLHRTITMFLKEGAQFVTLIKPQFEVGREGLGKKGIVKNDSFRQKACDRVIESCSSLGLELIAMMDSPIEGGDGNREFLAHFRYNPKSI